MSVHGLKVIDPNGKTKILTPGDGTVIAAGSLTMPNALNGDNTYGVDIPLGDTYNEDEISVLVIPRRPVFGVTYNRFIDTTLYYNTFYLDSAKTYYTRNTSTGVMTSFSAGNKTVNDRSTWDPVLSVFPIAFWDKRGASTFSSVRLFAATAYLIRDSSDDVNLSLAGSESGTGEVGVVGYINDDDEDTLYGVVRTVYNGDSAAASCYAQVTFSSATIYKAEVLQEEWASIYIGNYANGSWALKLYYNAQWNTVASGSWANTTEIAKILRSVTGHWRNVTGIRIDASISAQAAGSPAGANAEYAIWELRAWGTTNTDDSENKIVYSIGNVGVATADYMVCRKKFAG